MGPRPPRSTRTDTLFPYTTLFRRPGIYIRWARGMLMIYQGLTYSRGAMDKVFDRIFETPVRTEARKKVSEVTSADRSEEHTSELQSLMRISSAVFCLKKKTN